MAGELLARGLATGLRGMGRVSPGSRAAGVVVVALVLAVAGSMAFSRRVRATEPVLGVEWVQASRGPVASLVHETGPAWAAGVRPGDLLLAVDGRPVRSSLEAASRLWTLGPERAARLELARGPERLVVRVRAERRPRAEPYGYLVLVAIAFFVSGLFIALRWPSVRGGTVYGLLAATLFVHLTFSHTGAADSVDWAVYWVDRVVGALAPAFLLHFVFVVTRRALAAPRLTLGLAYLPAVGLLVADLWLSPAALGGAYRSGSPVLVEESRDRLQTLFLGLAVVGGLWAVIRSYHKSSSTLQHSQLRWLLWGLTVGLTPFVALYALPFSLGASELPSWVTFLSVLPMLIVPATFTAALARYRLYDLSLLLRQGFTEVTSVFFTFAAYATAREAARGLLGMSPSGSRYVGILVAVVTYPSLRTLVRTGVDRVFHRERYSYRATLLDWARELSAETDLRPLVEHVRRRVRETLDLPQAEVLMRNGVRAFERLDEVEPKLCLELDQPLLDQLERESTVALEPNSLPDLPWARWLFAMKVKGRIRAVLVTGDRPAADDPLSPEDRALLGTLSAHASTAIEAARLLHELRTRAEEIGQLHRRQEQILESSAVGLLLTDREGRILAWNRALEGIYGLDRGEAIGRRLGEVFPAHLVRRIQDEAASTPPGEQARIYRYTLIGRRGQRIVANLSVTLAGEPGGAGALVVTFDDVSERVKLEEQVLRQERLASLGLLAAGVAHEVNTPLTGISSYTQLLLEELPEGDPRIETLAKIEAQTRRASNIVNSLLNLARPERTELERLSLNDVACETLQLFAPQVRSTGISITTALDPELPEIRANRGKLQQVLLNLLMNARDACGRGGAIAISTSRCGETVRIEVVDNGVGIAESDLPRIFDPFFTTKGRGKGTGLGLSVSYGIVQEHGGEIHVDSAPGEFTRFQVELPVRSEAAAALA
jgi:PAS domain S-box-containing protein